jgi:hypothetical protein
LKGWGITDDLFMEIGVSSTIIAKKYVNLKNREKEVNKTETAFSLYPRDAILLRCPTTQSRKITTTARCRV